MNYYRTEIIKASEQFLGVVQGDSKHQMIVNTYNGVMGSKWGHTTPWCAIFVSTLAIICGYEKIIPRSASCGSLIELAKSMDIWQERDDYVPKPADIIIYDWNDGKNYATYDNKEGHDHTGIVVNVSGKYFTVREGNKGEKHIVDDRLMEVNGRYIRGFICPKYNDEIETKSEIIAGDYYVVKRSDTLNKIAKTYDCEVSDILILNPDIKNPNKIYVGQKITVPIKKSSELYSVVKGDTLSKIGIRLDVDWKDIAAINGIKFPYTIYPGQVLRIK